MELVGPGLWATHIQWYGNNNDIDIDIDDNDDGGGQQHKKCSVIRELHYIIINWTQASM